LTNFEINSLRKLINSFLQSAETIVDVFDRYDLKDSIKSAERERRSQAAGGHRIYHVNEGSSIPDWKKFACKIIIVSASSWILNKSTVCNLITTSRIPESPC
jgi:hypothetical protein